MMKEKLSPNKQFLNNLEKSQKEPLSESVNAKEFIRKIRDKYEVFK